MSTQTSGEPATAATAKEPGFAYAAGSVLIVVAILLVGSLGFDADIQLLLFISMVALVPLVMRLGYSFDDAENFAFRAIRSVLGLIMILMAVGALIGSWAESGTIPALVHLGLSVLSPQLFLPTTLLLCILASMATGTSWGTIGTVGVAMMGVGEGMGYPVAMTAGAIVCGAYFGDKMSPFSDSTNLNAALVGTDLTRHIRHLTWTTVPTILLCGGIFTVLGFTTSHGRGSVAEAEAINAALSENFSLGLPAFLPIVVVLVLLLMRKPAWPSIFVGALAGALVAVLYQGASVSDTLSVLYNGFVMETGTATVDSLVSGGGVMSMMGMVALFLFAIGMAGLLTGSGMLLALITPTLRWITTPRRLMVTSIFLVPALVALGGSFSFAAVMSGSLLLPLYHKFGLDPKNLSRILEDSGTANDPVFPWSSGGVFVAGVLGVSTLTYLPFYFFVFLSMAFSLLYAITGWKVPRAERSGEREPDGEAGEGPVSAPHAPAASTR
ncbi:Na+/H+ antiporter NhaC [Streptomyces xiamenensis]|uniref:Na+/H+ antiporter NhaC n=1 Tax=Streptomyces xiamenensis TaxID=408015 RepID=UPI0035DAA163